MQYLHCNISKETKTISYRNPISGHEWTENIPASGYYVTGGKLGQRKYRTLHRAMAAIDFDYKFNVLTSENNSV